MSDTTCRHCLAATSNGLVLCELCMMLLAKNLEFLPVYFVNLARWRPGTAGVRSVPTSREPRMVTSGTDRVSRELDEAGAKITGWAQALLEDRPQTVLPASHGEESSVRVACYFLTEHMTTIATLEWAGQIVTETTVVEQRLRKMTTEVAPGWYAGACRVCAHDTFVVPGLTWVTCRACGSTTYARDHLETVLAEAREWVARPKALAETVVALLDTEESVPRLYARIRTWAARDGKRTKDGGHALLSIPAVRRTDSDGDTVGPKRHRLGDVLDAIETERRTEPRNAVASAS